jgi:hypothetical protein
MKKLLTRINKLFLSQWFFDFDISTAEGRDSPLIASHYLWKASLTPHVSFLAKEKKIILVKDHITLMWRVHCNWNVLVGRV